MHSSIGVIIPTKQAAGHLMHCLPPLLQSPLKPRILIIDSSSTDGTATLAQSMGAETLIIPAGEFNHGTTREKGRRHLKTDIVVMMTQDAYATSSKMLEYLIQPILDKKAAVSYGKQLPHQGAGFFAAFPRRFNYPAMSHIRTLKEASTYGVYTFFCSNSCAAYSNEALDAIGGFPHALFGEDTIVTAKLLHKSFAIAYVAEAEVYHSHSYSLRQEFTRHFDMGLSRKNIQNLVTKFGSDKERGRKYVITMLKELWHTFPLKIPYAILQTVVKFCGYSLGQKSSNAPTWFKKALSSQKMYWY